jgi:2-amino-4-hydroxy-6-hydroxymethyldihydropteridine diphosphokinase
MTLFNHSENEARGAATQEELPEDRLILIGLGANLPSSYGEPPATLRAALARLAEAGATALRRSRFWHSAPVPLSDQPWYVNAVAAIETTLPPERLLALLHEVEAEFGRVRGVVNAPRLIDLDLLAYGREIREGGAPILPHPRLHQRAFVLRPLSDIAPGWVHPSTGRTLTEMIEELSRDQIIEPLSSGLWFHPRG